MTHATFTPAVDAFRFYDDDSTEAASTPLANENLGVTINLDSGDVAVQLRYRVQESGGADGATTDDYALQYSKGGGAFTAVTTTSSNVKASASGLTNDAATTNRATNGITNGSGSFIAGEQCTDATLDNWQLTASNYSEVVFGLTLVAADLADNDTLDFRVTLNGGTPGMTNSVTPRLTADKAVVYAGNGAVAAQAADAVGSGPVESAGAGAAVAQDGSVVGSGRIGWIGSGAVAADAAAAAGGGSVAVVGNDTVAAEPAAVAGGGLVLILGGGSVSGTSTASGSGSVTGDSGGAANARRGRNQARRTQSSSRAVFGQAA